MGNDWHEFVKAHGALWWKKELNFYNKKPNWSEIVKIKWDLMKKNHQRMNLSNHMYFYGEILAL